MEWQSEKDPNAEKVENSSEEGYEDSDEAPAPRTNRIVAHEDSGLRVGHLPPLNHRPSLPTSVTVSKLSPKLPPMERQTSTSPLVTSSGPDDSQTSLELRASLPNEKQPVTTLVRKPSQVHPVSEKEAEANGHVDKVSASTDKLGTTSCCLTATKLILSLFIGLYFGWFLQKSTVYKPEVIRNQFLFKEFVMLKTFLGALLSSQFCILMLSWIPPSKPYVELAMQAYANTLCNKGIISSIVGTALLGAGMFVGGACPGMVLAQNGSLVANSLYTTLGGLLACFVYGFLHKYIIKITTPAHPYSTQFIHEKLKLPFVAIATVCMSCCLIAITLMEVFIPETERTNSLQEGLDTNKNTTDENMGEYKPELELATCHDTATWFTQEMWSPSACGVFIGLAQIPLILLFTDTMGSSSGYQTLVSQWVITKSLKEKFPYFANARTGLSNLWMVLYIFGAALGGALGALSSCSFLKAHGVPWWHALIGGFLMLFGSRLASGCTSGHGISGAAMLLALSWIAVPAMFAGGIATAFIMEYSGTNSFVSTWQP
ncbi:uncharacterized protein [Watersipora subatra]|uniref:uncharacterized protein n=1 Tax=Watersipora subatra TaxID=2589382 RepID=UPI00355B5BDC